MLVSMHSTATFPHITRAAQAAGIETWAALPGVCLPPAQLTLSHTYTLYYTPCPRK